MVEDNRERFKMRQVLNNGLLFINYPEALYETIATFQQCDLPAKVVEEPGAASRACTIFMASVPNQSIIYLMALQLVCLELIIAWLLT